MMETMEVLNETNARLENMTFEELRDRELQIHIPLVVFLVLIVVTGTIGNILVLYIYMYKYGPSNCRTFVLCLSGMDLLSCVIAVPIEIQFLYLEFDFHGAGICKASVFLNNWPTLTSGLMLVLIAVDRYRKVCQPFHWQISHRAAYFMAFVTAIVALAFSWLSPVIYGIQRGPHPDYNDVTISRCVVTDDMKQTIFPMMNNVFFVLLFLGSLICIIVMYCLIALRVKRHVQRREKMGVTRVCQRDTTEASEMTIMSGKVVLEQRIRDSTDDLETSDGMFYSTDGVTSSDRLSKSESTYSPNMVAIDNSEPDNSSKNRHSIVSRMFSRLTSYSLSPTLSSASSTNGTLVRNSRHRRSKSKQQRINRTAFIMFLVSLAFIISYLPLLSLLLIRTLDSGFVRSLSNEGRGAYKFFLRSYYLNCAVNPVIYGLWDSRFRKETRRLLCKLFKKS